MSKTERTPVFWIGLVVLGYAIVQFSTAIWYLTYILAIYPALVHSTGAISTALLTESLLVSVGGTSFAPTIISGVIFAVIGIYIMRVGGRKRSSNENSNQAVTTQLS